MITIKQPTVTIRDGKARLSADVDVDGVCKPLWFEVAEEYSDFLCPERSDAYVLGLLRYANLYGHDIVTDVPMTDTIYSNLTDQFYPAFYKVNNYSRNNGVRNGFASRIICPTAPSVEVAAGDEFIGTGVSCGVDSLHVFALHPEITHGCIWNGHTTGAGQTEELRKNVWRDMILQAKEFLTSINKKLIVGDTNYDRGWMRDLSWEGYTTFGNLFCVFAMQKMWKRYFIASNCDINDFRVKLSINNDPAAYEFFLFPYLSTGNISIYMDGHAHRRIEKVRDLLNYAPAKKFLNVCWGVEDGFNNCSYKCAKCVRTVWSLYLLDALDEFKDRFDVCYFNSHKEEFLAEFYRGLLQKDFFMVEMKPYYKGKKISFWIKLLAFRIVLKKAIKKLLRLGKVAQGEFKSR